MKIKFKILIPQRPDQSSGYDTIINYDPTSFSGKYDQNAKSLYNTFESSGYFSRASGSGFDFDKIFSKFGLNVREYAQVSSYSVSKIAATVIAKEASKWSNVVQCIFPQGSLKDYFEGGNSEIYVYEWVPKTLKGKEVIVFGPAEEDEELNLMYAKTIHTETVELKSEEALSYFTDRSIFILKRSELRDVFESLLGESMSSDLRWAIDNFKDGGMFGMWSLSSIEDRFDFNPDQFPWALKVKEIQEKIKEIIELPDICMYRKYILSKNIIKSI